MFIRTISDLSSVLESKEFSSSQKIQKILLRFKEEERTSGAIYFDFKEQKYFHRVDRDYFLNAACYEKHLVDTNSLAVNIIGRCGWTLALIAAKVGDVDLLDWLVQQGANLHLTNDFGCSTLFVAAGWGNVKTIHYLLGKNVNINEHTFIGPYSTNCGPTPTVQTALHNAVRYGHPEICEVLLKNGARLIDNGNKRSPIDLASFYLDLVLNGDSNQLREHFGVDTNTYPSEKALRSIQKIFHQHVKYRSYIHFVYSLTQNDQDIPLTRAEVEGSTLYIALLKLYFSIIDAGTPFNKHIKTKILEYVLGDLNEPRIGLHANGLFSQPKSMPASRENETAHLINLP